MFIKKSISVFFPCYNDKQTIVRLILDTDRTLNRVVEDYEIIVVDDGSTDGSQEVLKKAVSKIGKLRLIFHKKNQGYGRVLQSGFSAATKELVFYTDGDGQYDVKEITLLIKAMNAKVNFVNGVRVKRFDPFRRILLGNLYRALVKFLFRLPLDDWDCDFRLVRKELLEKINLVSNSGGICFELVKKAQRSGAKFAQVPVHHYSRQYGQSKFFTPKNIILTFKEIGRQWFQLMIADSVKKI